MLIFFRVSNWWYVLLKASISDIIPLEEKNNISRKPRESMLLLCVIMVSVIVSYIRSYADPGKTSASTPKSSNWKFSIGIKGIKLKRKISAGNSEIKRLYATDEARIETEPLLSPLMKNVPM